ncbi:hypothetical protein ABIF26_006453 [Bradyrhizobium elkanii]
MPRDGGEDIPAAAHSPEAREKALAGRKNSALWRDAIVAANARRKGVPLSAEHRRAIGDGNRGKKLSSEHCAKLSAKFKGRKLNITPELREKLSKGRRGKALTEEHKRKIGEAGRRNRDLLSRKQAENWKDPEYRARVLATRPKTLSSESRAKAASNLEKCRSDPSINERRLAGIRAAQEAPEYREQARLRARRLWADPEFRAKMKAARAR